jgi:hypothetical protein
LASVFLALLTNHFNFAEKSLSRLLGFALLIIASACISLIIQVSAIFQGVFQSDPSSIQIYLASLTQGFGYFFPRTFRSIACSID